MKNGKSLFPLILILILSLFQIIKGNETVPETFNMNISNTNIKISVQNVKKILISHSGLSEKDIKITKLILKKEKGIFFYEIRFLTKNKRYNYNIDANTGAILKYNEENKTPIKEKISIFDIIKIPFN
ncbi:MAG: PepSY domain-containing protein [Leptotrichiaceae bacterium]|nr:PepSY domain-containing protein [Leptotrichiaceae bacterium]